MRRLGRVPLPAGRALRRGAVLIVLLVPLVILGVLGRDGAARVTRAGYFEITSFSVQGNRRVPAETIISSLGLPAHSGILEVDLNGLAERIMRNPWIKTATVSRRLPGRLLIRVVERTPRTIILADRAYLISEDGLILKEAGPEEMPALPLLRLDVDRRLDLGGRIEAARLEEGARLWRQLDGEVLPSGVRAREVRLERGGTFTVSLGPDMPHLRVRGARLDEQMDRLARVLRIRGVALDALEYADLRFADKVIFKLRPKNREA
ncbi:MAG: cell division protein FtsQ/DivIB [Candidatus Methylomirabilaceae bacterium]